MLRNRVIILSVMTGLALSGCSKSETSVEEADTLDNIANTAVESIKVSATPVEVSDKDTISKDAPDLVKYTVANRDYAEKCGFKNTEGKIVVRAEYDFCGDFSEGMAYLLKQNLKADSDGAYYLGYVNSAGKLVIPVDIEADYGWMLDPRDFSQGIVAVLKKGKWGYMDKEGKSAIPFNFDSASNFTDSVATVSKDYKYGVINQNGETVVNFKYDQLGEFKEGLAAFTPADSEKQGFINTKGEIIVAATWDQVMGFSEGQAAVAKGDYENAKWGFIDAKGKVVIEPKYDNVYIDEGGDSPDVIGGYFENGTIDVYQNGENDAVTAITIDKNGKELKRKEYASFFDLMQ